MVSPGEEVSLHTANVMGANAISAEELKALHQRLAAALDANDDLRRDFAVREEQLQALRKKAVFETSRL